MSWVCFLWLASSALHRNQQPQLLGTLPVITAAATSPVSSHLQSETLSLSSSFFVPPIPSWTCYPLTVLLPHPNTKLMDGTFVARWTQCFSVIASSILWHSQYCLNPRRKAVYSPQTETRPFGTCSWMKRDGKGGRAYFSDFSMFVPSTLGGSSDGCLAGWH